MLTMRPGYCMQHICISMWSDAGDDMVLKVTDICSTDPNDPTARLDPEDIKIDRRKAATIFHTGALPTGDVYPEEVWWNFIFCLGDVSSSACSQILPSAD